MALLFHRRKSIDCRGTGAISRQQAYAAINAAARAVGIKEAIGTHTLHKTSKNQQKLMDKIPVFVSGNRS
jgi:hypothetical protein